MVPRFHHARHGEGTYCPRSSGTGAHRGPSLAECQLASSTRRKALRATAVSSLVTGSCGEGGLGGWRRQGRGGPRGSRHKRSSGRLSGTPSTSSRDGERGTSRSGSITEGSEAVARVGRADRCAALRPHRDVETGWCSDCLTFADHRLSSAGRGSGLDATCASSAAHRLAGAMSLAAATSPTGVAA